MDQPYYDVLRELLVYNRWAVSGTSLGALALIGWMAGWLQRRRRSQALARALAECTSGALAFQRGPDTGGFRARIEPAPEPFVSLQVEYRAVSRLSPADLVGWLLARRTEQLRIHGKLSRRPSAEIVWARGRIPGHALGKAPSAALWERRRMDIIDSEYVTRGVNTHAIANTLVDFQTRFGPFMRRFSVQADDETELRLVLNTARLSTKEIPALIATARAGGRAALLS